MSRLTDKQNEIKKQVRNFIDAEVRPRAIELDRTGEFPFDIIKRMSELGFIGLPFPKELGGSGYGVMEGLIFVEEISRGLGSLGIIMCSHLFQCAYTLMPWVTPKQQEEWLCPAICGEKLLTLALSENSGGSDVFGIDTIATRTSDGWLLNGSKAWITNAGVADGYIVCARTSVNSSSRDISLFYVDANTPGVDADHREYMIGLNNSPTGGVVFRDCLLPLDSIIGSESKGYKIIKGSLNNGRLALSAMAIGIAEAAMELAVDYSGKRGSFGRVISSHQGVSFPIAEMYMNITVARNMLYNVAELTEVKYKSTVDTAALKLFSTQACQKVCSDCLLLHGGKGYSKDYDAERLMRDSQLLTTAVGTSQICKIIISNALFAGHSSDAVPQIMETNDNHLASG